MDEYEKTVVLCVAGVMIAPLFVIFILSLLGIDLNTDNKCTCCKKHRPDVQIEKIINVLKSKNIIKSEVQNPPEGW